MRVDPFPVDYLLDLAEAARAHVQYNPADTEAHSPSQIAAQAERAAAAIQRLDWRAAANLHYGIVGAIGDAAHFSGVKLDPTGSVEARLGPLDALDRAEAREQWAQLTDPIAIEAYSDRVVVQLGDRSRVEASFSDAYDPVSSLINWIWERDGVGAVLDALAHVHVRPGDDETSHGRVDPAP